MRVCVVNNIYNLQMSHIKYVYAVVIIIIIIISNWYTVVVLIDYLL